MRDIALSLTIIYLLLRTFRSAEYGAYLWAWLSLMNPHRMTWGFAYNLPWAQAAAGVGIIGMLLQKEKSLPKSTGVWLLGLLWFWMTVTALFSINPPAAVFDRWVFVSKIMLMFFVALSVIRERRQINTMVAVVVFSLAFFGIKGGVFTVATGGSYRVWGPPASMMEENNALAVALIMVLPLMYYLYHIAKQRWLRWALVFGMLMMGASIFGSQSRGALLAMVAMTFLLGLKSRYPFRISVLLGILVVVGMQFMPDTWTDRMETIRNHTEDASAMSRLYTWQTLWNVAVDRPLVGAGFRADNVPLFTRYAPTDAIYSGVENAWVAHSIYFQALGEHGFVGLGLFLSIWVWLWFAARRLAREAEVYAELRDWLPMLMRMCQVATVGYLVGGAFLSLMNLDLPYYLLVFVILCQRELSQTKARATQVTGEVAGQPPPTRWRAQTAQML